ncbi:outer membrane beta-barrel protein [Cochleicola gelatinilyticus]|uniref:Outer membrane protein beta-barrel domain-containing protein n=1 Tax=Cochleicola gelatinilyticus TaxID=1763537 RepID=A0A167EXF8_9FLAO|nr:outer membrane beta-barrel protein [Cochleicola gelatinilyticus]OAB75972.1 hypothetical protein ULVI_12965 [Cochleicola gelatinilyticus]
MSKHLLFLLCVLVSLTANAQTEFLHGYFITTSGERTDCLIKNEDWRNTPKQFIYKINENSEVKTKTISNVQEISVPNVFKFVKHTVQIDLWSEPGNKADLDSNSQANYIEQTILLKVLVEGEASLFQFENNGLKYFYSLNGETPKQLFYKRYMKTDYQIAENNQYRQQLFNTLSCEGISRSEVSKLQYNRKKLINFFKKYNQCKNVDFKVIEPATSSGEFNLTIRPGVNFSSIELMSAVVPSFAADFGSQTNFRIGVEAELVLGFNNKWSVFLEPTYRSLESEVTIPFRSTVEDFQDVAIKYSSLEIPVGIRHYLFLNDTSKIFFNVAFVYDFVTDSIVDWEFSPINDRELDSGSNLAFGIGYKYGERLSAEFRFFTNRSLAAETNEFPVNYKQSSIIVGYTLF